MKNKPYFFQMAVKEVDNGDGTVVIEGFASTPDVDRYKDIVEPQAFSNALKMYMKNPVLLYQHDPDRPVGTVSNAVVTERGLKITAEILDEDTKQKVSDGRMRAMSIGFIPLLTELQHEDGTPFNFEEDSIWDSDLIRVIKELDLVEISIVTTPANGNALFTVNQAAKKFFHEVITKSLHMKKKNIADPVDQPKENLETEEQKPTEVETPAETPVEGEEAKAEEPKAEAPAEETTPTEQPKEPENGGDTPKQEESENAGEEPAPAAGEGVEPKAEAEEPATEEKPVEGEEPTDEEKGIVVDAKTAETLGMLVKAGVLRVAQEGEKATSLSKNVVDLMQKMTQKIEEQHEEIKGLKTKLDETPEKKSLVLTGQFEAGSSEKEIKNDKKDMSNWMAGMFDNAIRAEV